MFKFSRPSLVFADSDNMKTIEDALHELNINVPIYVFGDQKHNRSVTELFVETGTESQFIPPSIADGMKQIAVIICSSGTTGLSKGVSVSYSSVLNNMLATLVFLFHSDCEHFF